MKKFTALDVEKLETRALLSAAPIVNNPSPKPSPQSPSSPQPVILKSEIVWPPKLKNPPRITVEPILKPKAFFGMNPNDSFWYFPKSDRRNRRSIETDNKSDNITLDESLRISFQDSRL